MPKEWNGPSEYFAAGGLYGNQNRKAIFRSVVPLEGSHRFDATDYEEAAADLSLKKEKPCYGDESMDLSTKWRAPPVSPHPTTFAQPAQQQQQQQHHHHHHPKHFAQHMRLLPRKRSPPDLVVLSEEELNGDATMPNGGGPPSPPLRWGHEELRHKRRILRELRDELRSEEMKLVLLKKLHQSQMMKENLLNQAAAAVAGKIMPAAPSHRAAPPPLVRQNSTTLSQNKMLNQQLSSHHTSTTISAASTMMGHHGMGRSGVPTPPLTSYSSATTQMVSQPACPSPERTDGQTPAQRQAAAKLALRKQLEKTLLQIPPPKPPPPEMHFVPNANNQEFICLLGLEKVVDLITDDPSMLRPPPEPFECVQCGTDFSPVWKWQQDAARSRHHNHKPSVICENCVTSNIKRALKAEHTNRLKTAFVKALQQEQEIEQRMAAGAPSPPPIASPSPAPPPCTLPPTTTSHSSLPKLSSMGSSLLQHLPKLTHQSLLHAQQHFAQPAPAHMLPFAPLLAAQAYSYQLLGGKSSAELQRQYLLDMIPPRSSLPQSNWKT